MNTVICVDDAIGESLTGTPQLVSIPRRVAGVGPWRHWRPVDPDRAIAELADIAGDAYVLVRADDADPGGSVLGRVAAALGRPVLHLPDKREDAVRLAATAAEFAATAGGGIDVHRAIEVICGSHCGESRHGIVPARAVRPGVLSRWAARAWTACRWCTYGAALGALCPACGTPIGRA